MQVFRYRITFPIAINPVLASAKKSFLYTATAKVANSEYRPRNDQTGPDTRRNQLKAPLMTGAVIMPASTPHLSMIARYSPVEIKCMTACRSDSASGDPFATGRP
jgi:hypothetical protein